ncbi:receptor kinase-like protein Xa21 [Solanum verrucosum]|uniref:receptor kinase-like protein Xa21 n=1 Tax=Solanum verrucosum TaxID=315347 RepID=UPI0020D09877|nr:receptor kinase-like protein Xa21 [Solanum verrucosum]
MTGVWADTVAPRFAAGFPGLPGFSREEDDIGAVRELGMGMGLGIKSGVGLKELRFGLLVFILLHHHTSLTFVPNISTDEAALLALKSHISSHPNKKLVFFRPWEIPSSLSNLTKLQVLRIQNNFLQGEIPREIGDLRYLTILDLQVNKLTGSIPTSIFNITTLQNVALTENNLTGNLPITICDHLPNLEGLHLSVNYLIGVIPPNLDKCRKLQILSLTYNEFIGTVPRELSNLTDLAEQYIAALQLKGGIPVELGNLKKLQRLALSRNDLTGFVPASIFNMSTLQFLALSENKLSASISNSSKLRILDLSVNSFTGPIPESLGNLEYLKHLNFAGNNFFSDTTFRSLTSLTNCRNLRVLVFGGNQLDIILPTSVGNFSNSLKIFEAPACNLKGVIPKEIGNLTGLIHMSLQYNELTGHVPNTIQGMLNLQEFYLQSNKIEGTIPDAICNLKNLGALYLSGNQFSGSVPPCLGNVTSLRYLYIGYNMLNSILPESLGGLRDLLEFNISSNLLGGKIPLEIGNLKAATLIDLSKNNFSGKIPSTLGGLDKLINLSLAHNILDGPIPDSFDKLLALEFLDLCYNNIGGEIPKSLEALVYLKYLNFSFNKLSGEIPTGGPFANATGQTFLSNDALCGDSKFNATEGFNKSNLLGNGSFSMVYKGILKDGTIFAAKEFNVQLDGAFKSFDIECELLRNLRHSYLTKVTSCDVYSFGILMMETFTRMRPTDEIFTGDLSIQLWVSNSFPSGIHKVVDSNLIESGDKQIDAKMQCLLSIMELALSCTLVTSDARISMEDALLTLKKIRLQYVSSHY